MNRIRLSSAAQNDIAAAQEWYAEQPVPDLDLRFQRELEDALTKVEAFPKGFQVILKDIRRANLDRFPYAVFYHLRPEALCSRRLASSKASQDLDQEALMGSWAQDKDLLRRPGSDAPSKATPYVKSASQELPILDALTSSTARWETYHLK